MDERETILRSLSPSEAAIYSKLGGKLPRGIGRAKASLRELDQAAREGQKLTGRAWRWRAKERAA